MRIAYFDCFSGASGDMILGALVGAGWGPDGLRAALAQLHLADYELDIRDIRKQGFAAIKVDVKPTGRPGHRHLRHVVEIIDRATLSDAVKDRAKRIFTRLAEVEAAAHGTTIEKVHFHEVGAVDAIVNIVGAAAGLEALGLNTITCSPIPPGSGTVRCEHGLMPVPTPATAGLLVGIPLAPCDEPGELTTPTGAAILTTVSTAYGPMPAMRLQACGVGAGTSDGQTRPNILRLFVGQPINDATGATEAANAADTHASAIEIDQVVVLETNLDDCTGEQIGFATEALFAAGALDVFTTPVFMKKNRPGTLLSVLVSPESAAACETILFTQTTTLGIRRHLCHRRKLPRTTETVQTPYGPIRIKFGHQPNGPALISPEYEDCATAARTTGAPIRDIMFTARAAWESQKGR